MSISAFINGQLENGYIAEVPGLSPACRFKYKPMLVEARSAFTEQHGKAKSQPQGDRMTAAELASSITAWDLTGPDGCVVPITVDNIRKMKFMLFNTLAKIVIYGIEAGDLDPASRGQDDSDDDASLIAALSGTSINDARQGVAEKN